MSTAPYFDARPHLFTPVATRRPLEVQAKLGFGTRAIHALHPDSISK